MSLDELFAELDKLDRSDKLRTMQFLITRLAKEEDALLKSGEEYPVWSPYNAFDAAEKLLGMLNKDDAASSYKGTTEK